MANFPALSIKASQYQESRSKKMITAHSFLNEVCILRKAWFVELWDEVNLEKEHPSDKRRRRELAATREAFTGCKDWDSFFRGQIFGEMTQDEFQVKYRSFAYDLAVDSLRLYPDAMGFGCEVQIHNGDNLYFNPAKMIAKTLSPFHLELLFRQAIEAYTEICKTRLRSRMLEGGGFTIYMFERIAEIRENVDRESSKLLDLAAMCLAPNGESFEIDTLIKCFGFPNYEQSDFPIQDDFIE